MSNPCNSVCKYEEHNADNGVEAIHDSFEIYNPEIGTARGARRKPSPNSQAIRVWNKHRSTYRTRFQRSMQHSN